MSFRIKSPITSPGQLTKEMDYHIQNNTATGHILKALNNYHQACNQQIGELKRRSLDRIEKMSSEIESKLGILTDDLRRCEEAHKKIDEILKRF